MLRLARGLDRERYRSNARVFHRWNARLGVCEVSVAGALLAAEAAVSTREGADAVWAHMLRRDGLGPALRAVREIDIGDVHHAVGTLGCWDAELRHRAALERLRFEAIAYEGWESAEAQWCALEALARRLRTMGL